MPLFLHILKLLGLSKMHIELSYRMKYDGFEYFILFYFAFHYSYGLKIFVESILVMLKVQLPAHIIWLFILQTFYKILKYCMSKIALYLYQWFHIIMYDFIYC